MPSTLANQWDLLANWKILLQHGQGSLVHMFYQLLSLSASLVGPASIFLLLVSGLHLAIGMSLWISMAINFTAVGSFIFVSTFFEQRYQLLLAKVLSVLYGILALVKVILVIESLNWNNDCTLSPPIASIILVISAFLLSGLLHYKQFKILLYGIHYFCFIPCVYLFLPFYCIFNMSDTSWGTREVVVETKKTKLEDEIRGLVATVSKLVNKDDETDEMPINVRHEGRRNAVIALNQGNGLWTDGIQEQIKRRMEGKIKGRNEDEFEQLDRYLNVLEVSETEMDAELWTYVVDKLTPLNSADETARTFKISTELRALKTKTLLLFLFCNIAFIFTIFLMELNFQETGRFALNWPLCSISQPSQSTTSTTPRFNCQDYQDSTTLMTTITTTESIMTTTTVYLTEDDAYYPLDPMNMVFLMLFLGVMAFLMCGMVIHKVKNIIKDDPKLKGEEEVKVSSNV